MYLFFDTETTGLSRRGDHVVQLAWALTDSKGDVKLEDCYVIRPSGYEIPPAAARVHGITNKTACQIGKPLKQVLAKFSDAAAAAQVIIAHNLSFDFDILRNDYSSCGMTFPLNGKIHVCTMKLSTTWCRLPKMNGSPGFKWPTLNELHYRLFGEAFDGAHDALLDTRATVKCYFKLVENNVIVPPTFSDEIVIDSRFNVEPPTQKATTPSRASHLKRRRSEPSSGGAKTVLSDSPDDCSSIQSQAFTSTQSVNLSCQSCQSQFSVTLARYEVSARCPECLATTNAGVKW